MRIVGGIHRGRRLVTPRDARTRPMLERTREAVFDMLQGAVEGARVLDLFAGTGSFGLEALSRGASHAVFVERDPVALRCLEANREALAVADRSEVRRGPVERVVAELPDASFELAMLDPPYREVEDPARRGGTLALAAHVARRVLSLGGTLVFHFPAGSLPEGSFGDLAARVRRYGRNEVALLARSRA